MPNPTDIDWPEAILGCPLRTTYRSNPRPRFMVMAVQDGPARLRLNSSDERRDVTVSFIFTAAQLMDFEIFYGTTLKFGTLWFNMPMLTGVGMIPYICHFSGERSVAPHPNSMSLFTVNFDLETYATPWVPPPPFAPDDPVDAADPALPSPDVYDARTPDDLPPDAVNALVPGAHV